ncbi:Bug family tripartite tricarboxylate transporter substrate binding protein [Pararoseomonas indoligenes]|uniref:Tripartite tricarboxylate transporter substrate binding protein n=1 Tax=Roseomonas indoligenes TaxID=2820811 RepID=A0A940N1V0_9PROT|nr:tripartite tricarboxylate transporter substrate binding protein [Pararoseomonas indoligenes]MBP0492697.1 tripartite tricarboxylate transporter substrate binding protein [Pararoseomonas indoligenes]
MSLPRRTALAALAAAATLRGAAAQSDAITLVVPTAPAGTTDFAARLLAEPLSRQLGQPVVVENKGGANGALGTQDVARARPDGTRLLVQYSGYHVGTPALVPNIGYDVRKDFAPVSLLLDAPQVVFLHPSVPAATMGELVAYAKAHPGELNYASSGNGSLQHLGTELLKLRTGTQMTHVSYRGTGPATQDLVAGRVQLMITTPPPLMPFVREGRLKAIAITAPERHPALPDVPTLAEQGLPNLEVIGWFAVFAPAGTPEAVLRRLTEACNAVVATPEFRRRAEEQGAIIRVMQPPEIEARVGRELDEWTRVVREARIQPD